MQFKLIKISFNLYRRKNLKSSQSFIGKLWTTFQQILTILCNILIHQVEAEYAFTE